MIEAVLACKNMHIAYKKVVAKKGSAGVDNMPVNELKDHLSKNGQNIMASIQNGVYLPKAILGVSIPKSKGKTRLLGIPTVTDRWLQQAVTQAITPLFEYDFLPHSYGFRPNKNAQQCVMQSQRYINDGYNHIVDIDLKNFFDEVDHCMLLQLLYRKVKCKITLLLIRKWLRAPMLINGVLTKRRKGVPQGSPLSPLLSNILLHELDKMMTKEELRFVRYADDFSVYTKSDSAARKARYKVINFLHEKLHLQINTEKSGIRRPVHFQILGYKFVPVYAKGSKGQYQLVVSEKSWKHLQMNLKSITRKTTPLSIAGRTQKLKQVSTGWIQYFRLASIQGKLKELDSWARNRLRYCIWKDWKKANRRRINLMKLGVDAEHAYAWSRTRKGGWAVAQSPIMTTTITLERLEKRGYQSMLDYYLKVSPQLNEPLFR